MSSKPLSVDLRFIEGRDLADASRASKLQPRYSLSLYSVWNSHVMRSLANDSYKPRIRMPAASALEKLSDHELQGMELTHPSTLRKCPCRVGQLQPNKLDLGTLTVILSPATPILGT